ncbi:hypothetical protein [uncultured Kordia sp.]|uniref:hypothetical protein n=1 Tax=uncultured Kordia sp. TaxID=507699 RepID=UPI0026212598|nr:hypothetical protein [uncultured Kordia sp.]
MTDENIVKVNEAIAQYFEANTTIDWIPVKTIMPALVEAGVFVKDVKKGFPLRKVLRKLDKQSQLDKIPSVHAERRAENTYWYLVREGKTYTPKEEIPEISKKEQRKLAIKNSDENYLLDMCDELLDQKASRKHTFDTLVGNLHKRGKGRTKLPLDAYYKDLKLVIEFFQKEKNFEDLDEKEQARITQIKYYDELKKEAVLNKKFRYMKINYAQFECNENGKLIRNTENDTIVLKNILKDFLED